MKNLILAFVITALLFVTSCGNIGDRTEQTFAGEQSTEGVEPAANAAEPEMEESESAGLPAEETKEPEELEEPKESEEPEEPEYEPDEAAQQITDLIELPNIKGIYVTAPRAGSGEYIDPLIELCEESLYNAMVIDFKNESGRITCRGAVPFMDELELSDNFIRDPRGLVERLKNAGIYVIARVVTFKDNAAVEFHPEWYIKNPDGSVWYDKSGSEPYAWMDPYNRDTWEYIAEISEALAMIGVDEIQFDYIRFSTGKGIDNCVFAESDLSKTEIITEFTKYMYERLKPFGVYVSADVYGTIIDSALDASLVGQDYKEMSKHLDFICPMVYPSHYNFFSYNIEYPDLQPYDTVLAALNASREVLDTVPDGERCADVRPWLQDFTASYLRPNEAWQEYGETQREEQIRAVYDAGYSQWLLWDARVSYDAGGVFEP